MIGELYINGKDAYLTFGIVMEQSGLSALMTPAPMKKYIENKSALENGKRVVITKDLPKVSERKLQLTLGLQARNKVEFFIKYELFCKELAKGKIEVRTRYQPLTIYRTIYISCRQFKQYNGKLGKFVLNLVELDPTNRGLTDKNEEKNG